MAQDKAKVLKTNFSAGELSPRLLGRPDLAKFFNGAALLENFYIFPQGGIYRPPGSRFLNEVKDSTKVTRLIPFIFSRSVAYVLEFGDQYVRFYRNSARLGAPYELATPYLEADLFSLQFEQSADVLFIDHESYEPRKLIRVSDTNWSLSTLARRPPPSVEDDTDISAGTTLTPSATTGTGINFTCSGAKFLTGDIDRNIKYSTSRAVITALGGASPNAVAVCDILDPFPNTNPIPSGQWFLDHSPSSYNNISKKPKLGGTVSMKFESDTGTAQDAERAADVGKFIKIFGGLIEITVFTDAQNMKGILRVPLVKNTDTNPLPVAGGEWTQEVVVWNTAHGFPSAITFYQGRLTHGGTPSQPTTWWLSSSDDFENYGVGSRADFALQYTNTGQLNNIRWLLDLGPLFIGTMGGIWMAKGPGVDQPLGGDVLPFVKIQDAAGSLLVKPIRIGTKAVYIEASGKQVYELSYNTEAFDNTFRGVDITRLAEHIGGSSGFKQEQIGWASNPNRHAFFVRKDGGLAVLTYYPSPEGVIGWSRRTTDGTYESVCVIPHPDQDRDQIWVIANRTINGMAKRYVEYFEDNAAEFVGIRNWTELHTDCAKVYNGAPVTVITDLSHLEAKTVAAVADGSYKGTFTVASSQITLPEAHSRVEVGLPYISDLLTMPAAVQDSILDDQQKQWERVTIRLKGSVGGALVNPITKEHIEDIIFPPAALDSGPDLVTGKKPINATHGWNDEGQFRIQQQVPYPFTILSISGRLNVGDL